MSTRLVALVAVAGAVVLPQVVGAQDTDDEPDTAIEWFDRVTTTTPDRLDGIDHYVRRIRGGQVPGLTLAAPEDGTYGPCYANCLVTTTVPVELPGGESLNAGYVLSPTEVAVLAGAAPGAHTVAAFGSGLIYAQEVENAVIDRDFGRRGQHLSDRRSRQRLYEQNILARAIRSSVPGYDLRLEARQRP